MAITNSNWPTFILVGLLLGIPIPSGVKSDYGGHSAGPTGQTPHFAGYEPNYGQGYQPLVANPILQDCANKFAGNTFARHYSEDKGSMKRELRIPAPLHMFHRGFLLKISHVEIKEMKDLADSLRREHRPIHHQGYERKIVDSDHLTHSDHQPHPLQFQTIFDRTLRSRNEGIKDEELQSAPPFPLRRDRMTTPLLPVPILHEMMCNKIHELLGCKTRSRKIRTTYSESPLALYPPLRREGGPGEGAVSLRNGICPILLLVPSLSARVSIFFSHLFAFILCTWVGAVVLFLSMSLSMLSSLSSWDTSHLFYCTSFGAGAEMQSQGGMAALWTIVLSASIAQKAAGFQLASFGSFITCTVLRSCRDSCASMDATTETQSQHHMAALLGIVSLSPASIHMATGLTFSISQISLTCTALRSCTSMDATTETQSQHHMAALLRILSLSPMMDMAAGSQFSLFEVFETCIALRFCTFYLRSGISVGVSEEVQLRIGMIVHNWVIALSSLAIRERFENRLTLVILLLALTLLSPCPSMGSSEGSNSQGDANTLIWATALSPAIADMEVELLFSLSFIQWFLATLSSGISMDASKEGQLLIANWVFALSSVCVHATLEGALMLPILRWALTLLSLHDRLHPSIGSNWDSQPQDDKAALLWV